MLHPVSRDNSNLQENITCVGAPHSLKQYFFSLVSPFSPVELLLHLVQLWSHSSRQSNFLEETTFDPSAANFVVAIDLVSCSPDNKIYIEYRRVTMPPYATIIVNLPHKGSSKQNPNKALGCIHGPDVPFYNLWLTYHVTEVKVITILEQINTQIISQTTEYSKWKGDIDIAHNFQCAIRKPVPKRPPLAVKWEKPNQHMDGAKLNIDGCCKRELGIMAGGGIIRDGKG
ncbi:Uncharacterized protein Fot_25137 [Forsythia ovata]|uniref:Uncharacterized protein n=1 Tax=Forsythia ovata TaxID=205694 RepID=A0ABD1U8A1_9LAMI